MKRLSKLNIRDVRHLCKHLGTDTKEIESICADVESRYSRQVGMTSGKRREFATPRGRFRAILDRLNALLQRVELPDSVHGGRKGRSYLTNAEVHVRKPVLLKSDIKNFFPSVSSARVYALFVYQLGCSPDVARYLTRLTTLDGHLPQGSPTSTIVAAMVSVNLAKRVEGLARVHRADSGQYVDDICISGPIHLSRLQPTLERIVRQERFPVNRKKTTVVRRGEEQVVTGVRVNEGFDVPRKKLLKLRDAICKVERRLNTGVSISDREWRSLEGKARFVQSLNPGSGRFYLRRIRKLHRAYSVQQQ